ncbi:MAG: phosphate ABC transporter permease PstA [bacterium]
MKTVTKASKFAQSNPSARGEPALWSMGGTLVLGVFMIVAFLGLVVWNGIIAFYPQKIQKVVLMDGRMIAGEPRRHESYKPQPKDLAALPTEIRSRIGENNGFARRTLYKTGNFDLYNEDYKWVDEFNVKQVSEPGGLFYIERIEWGPFIGFIESADFGGTKLQPGSGFLPRLRSEHDQAVARRAEIARLEKKEIGGINYQLEAGRLALKRIEMTSGRTSARFQTGMQEFEAESAGLNQTYQRLQVRADALKAEDQRFTIMLKDIEGRPKSIRLSEMVRFYDANQLSLFRKLGVYFSRWGEFITAEPREANTEGGVMPAIFGTLLMTLLLVIAVAPFGVMAALYLREYAKQGYLVSIVRICVNNLAGVPSIVYGVFGLGFFAYTIGGGLDALFFAEKLPSPTFGTGGLLWASLTLALLTVPVVIVATEEALAAVPQSMREGSLACGASKWQTIKNIVLPKALPGIMTGLILAMARGAGEVAPLMLVGVVKLAPELPLDGHFPFLHLERSFMHLGFHIFDVGFQSRNAEAGKPMVFVTTLLLIVMVATMNGVAIYIRSRLNRKFASSHF